MYISALTTALLLGGSHAVSAYDTLSTWSPTAVPYTGQCGSIAADLGPGLSTNATIVLPGNSSFEALEIRSSSPRIQPTFTAIVEVATEEDIQQTIRYADRCDIPFLAVAGGHGWQSTINNANGAIQINMRKMQQIELESSGTLVRIGGGVLQRHLTQTLYSLGKQAVTGLCECTSIIGPLLGGGHSVLQGFHGFVSDNLLSARVVLANGTAVTASATEHPDLFWALRGAGHNFGIVASFEVKAYDLPKTNWTIVSIVYTQDKLEEFIDALNEVDNEGDHVPELVLAGAITRIAAFDTVYPVVAYQLSYLGTADEVEPYVARFRQAGPISVTTAENVAYNDYYIATSNGYNQTTCEEDNNISGYAISLRKYNKAAVRQTFGYFSNLTADARYNTSVWLLESYGSRGVWAQNYSATAVAPAERNLPVLTVPITWWAGNSTEAREKAETYGKLMRAALAAGDQETSSTSHVYLNYAIGDESREQVYGAEPLPRLQALKKRYDPANKFGFYMPLV
ncbi:hypothetical protein LTR36_008198 [Oleoguttula mirabilis]|uniref:FAD-binding PCMH-type domain-containing protein n=1 Tax=Oleoguttula mirabilis TaxID=1507867 RepID=A0AAV9J877_9PEZI|nr:hypothetical protein LTR36_008198 [Oleoguttula mirabilis]